MAESLLSEDKPCLWLVATPIGNLQDFSQRGLQVLQDVACIFAETPRHTKKLLAHYECTTPVKRFNRHDEVAKENEIMTLLAGGQSVALVSDAGTPLINDPGARLVAKVQERGGKVSLVPGPCALIAGLVLSGFANDSFSFKGFFPRKKSAQQKELGAILYDDHPNVYYESPQRIKATIATICEVLGPKREVAILREFSKVYEEIYRGPVSEILERSTKESTMARGEIVLTIGPTAELDNAQRIAQDLDSLLKILLPEVSLHTAIKLAVRLSGASYPALARSQVYGRALELSQEDMDDSR